MFRLLTQIFINGAIACLLIIMIFSLKSCYWDNEERLYVQPPVPCDTAALASYNNVVLPILKTSCYSCHNAKNYISAGDNINLEGYEKLKRWANDGSLLGSISHDKKYFKM